MQKNFDFSSPQPDIGFQVRQDQSHPLCQLGPFEGLVKLRH